MVADFPKPMDPEPNQPHADETPGLIGSFAPSPPSPATPHRLLANWLLGFLLYPLMFGSGAAGLTLILLWMRRFSLVYGEGLAMRLVVPAAMLAGLAIGAWGLGRLSESLRRPIFIYAFSSLAVGAFAFLMPFFMPSLALLNDWAGGVFGGHTFFLGMLRFLMTLALVLIPVAMIGADLPVVASAVVSDPRHYGLKAGGLYSAFTLGGGCAAAFTCLFLLPRLELHLAEIAVGAFSLLIGMISLGIAFRIERPSIPELLPAWIRPRRGTGAVPDQVGVTLWAVFISGLLGMAAFVMWSRGLSLVLTQLGNTTYAEGASLTFFLIGVSIGCGLIGMVIDHQRERLRLFGLVLTLLGFSIIISMLMLHYGSELFLIQPDALSPASRWGWPLALFNLSSQTLGIVAMPALLTGMASTPAISLALEQRRMGRSAGRLLAIYIFGGMLGSLLGRAFLLEKFGLSLSLLGLGAVQTLTGLVTLHKASASGRHLAVMGTIAVLLLGGVALSLPGKGHRGLFPQATPPSKVLFYKDGAFETLAVLQDRLGYKTLYRQGAPVASTRPIDITCQKLLVHLPMILRDRTARVLMVGFGNGAGAYSILRHDRVREVDVTAGSLGEVKSSAYQSEANHDFLMHPNPRMTIHLGNPGELPDTQGSSYDLITLDFSDLRHQGQARRFSTTFFEECRGALGEDGTVAAWLPLNGLNAAMVKTALATFDQVFPESAVFYITSEPTRRLLLIGQTTPWVIDYRLCGRNLAESDVRDDLAEYFLDDLDKMLSFYVIGGNALDDFVADGAINDAGRPVLEFLAPRNIGGTPLEGLDALLDNSVSVVDAILPASISAGARERIGDYEKARPLIVQGHRQYLQDALEEATKSYLAALKITPGDLGLRQNLLGFPMLQQWIQAQPDDPAPYVLLGRLFMLQPDKLNAALELLGQGEARILSLMTGEAEAEEKWRKPLADIRIWMREIRRSPEREPDRWQ